MRTKGPSLGCTQNTHDRFHPHTPPNPPTPLSLLPPVLLFSSSSCVMQSARLETSAPLAPPLRPRARSQGTTALLARPPKRSSVRV